MIPILFLLEKEPLIWVLTQEPLLRILSSVLVPEPHLYNILPFPPTPPLPL